MATRFHLFYFSEGIGQYLLEVIRTSGQGVVVQMTLLDQSSPAALAPDAEHPADIWLVEYQEGVAGLDHRLEAVQQQDEPPAIFLYMEQADTHAVLKALRLGVQECFIGQINEDELAAALNRRQCLRLRVGEGKNTQVIGVLGCKGGVGVSFLAANLAQALAAGDGGPVLLLDLDLNNSDISSLMDLKTRYSIVDVIEKFDSLDLQYFKDAVHRQDSGLEVLPGPPRLEDRELVQAQHVQKILEFIRKQKIYRCLVLDLGDSLDEVTVKALEEVDLLLLVLQLTVPALRDAKKVLDILLLLEVPAEKIKLLANGYNPKISIAPKDAEKYLDQKLKAVLRFDHQVVTRSLNEGRLLVELLPNHKLSNGIKQLAGSLFPAEDENSPRQGMWAKLKCLLKIGN